MRRIAVSGGAVKDPKNFKVKIGTSYRELVEAAGGLVSEHKDNIWRTYDGMALTSLDVPVCKELLQFYV